jgi:cytochrome c-type biogenesis protein CcmH
MKKLAKLLLLPCLIVVLMRADNQDGLSPAQKARYQNLGSKIMCSCGCTQMLLKCNHVGCQNSSRMTDELRANVLNTSNDEDVLNWFRKKWGVAAVVEPSTHGFELMAWILPVAGLGFGLLLVILLIHNWRLRTAPVAAADVNLDPKLEALRARAHQETEI